MNMTLNQPAAILVALACAGTAAAGPLQREDVPGSAKWLIHIDVEQLKESRLGGHLQERVEALQPAAKLDAFAAMFNFDPRKDLDAVTLYGDAGRPDRSAVLCYGAFDQRRLVTLIRANDTYQRLHYGGETVHSWVDEKENVRTFGWIGDGVVRISQGRRMVEEGIDLQAGAVAGLLDDSELTAALTQEAPVLVVAAADLEGLEEIEPDAAVLKKAESLQLAVREAEDEVAASLRLVADSVRTAELVERVLNGMAAFGELQSEENPQLAALATAARIRRNRAVVDVEIRHPVDGVAAFLKQEIEAHQAAEAAANRE